MINKDVKQIKWDVYLSEGFKKRVRGSVLEAETRDGRAS
jgi:hypothetical protein